MPPKKGKRNPSLSSLLPSAPIEAGQSWRSHSTATLPPKYTITLAIPEDEALEEGARGDKYKEGQEYLADGWRREEEGLKEGKLWLRRRKRRFRFQQGYEQGVLRISEEQGSNEGRRDDELGILHGKPLWYTAGLQYGCTCTCITLI
jgi:hypothetical protein